MKKKIISALLTGALLLGLSVGASAATVTAGVTQANGTITVSGAVSNATTGQQVTVLVVKDGTDLDELVSSDVAYIDQVSATGNYSVSFQVPTDMNYGAYDVYVGGTQVTTLATTDFVVEGTHTLSGEVGASVNGANLTKIWIRVYQAGTETLVSETYANADGSFALSVPNGTYDIKVGRDGYLTRTYQSVTVNADDSTTVNGLTLLAGDVDENGSITPTDATTVISVIGLLEGELLNKTDLDDSGFVSPTDATVVFVNIGLDYLLQ